MTCPSCALDYEPEFPVEMIIHLTGKAELGSVQSSVTFDSYLANYSQWYLRNLQRLLARFFEAKPPSHFAYKHIRKGAS
jgi:hypothetical protein